MCLLLEEDRWLSYGWWWPDLTLICIYILYSTGLCSVNVRGRWGWAFDIVTPFWRYLTKKVNITTRISHARFPRLLEPCVHGHIIVFNSIWSIRHVSMASSSNLYRSKTCGFCGYIHKKLGGSKVFCCPQCKTNLDRDINGARNILLRYLTKKESA